MKTALLLALALCLSGVALLPAAEAGPVCSSLVMGCQGLACVTTQGRVVCAGGHPQCDPAECPPDS